MKSLFITIALGAVTLFAISAEPAPASLRPIKTGMAFSGAKTILSASGLASEVRYYDMIIPPGTAIQYFPVAPNVALVVTVAEATDQITHLALMTSPAYRPAKGLEVYLPLREIAFASDGSYTAYFSPAPKPK